MSNAKKTDEFEIEVVKFAPDSRQVRKLLAQGWEIVAYKQKRAFEWGSQITTLRRPNPRYTGAK